MQITAHYIRVGARTVHYRHRGSGAPVVLLHASPRSSVSLEALMRAAPDGVSVFAPDTPGFGHSDPLSLASPTIEDFADALAETLTALGIARIGLYGTHTGADIALVFAVRHPTRVVRLVLDGVSCFDGAERADLLEHHLPPFTPKSDGTHLTWLWSRIRDQALFFPWYRGTTAARLPGPMPDADALHRIAVDWLCAGEPRAAYLASIQADSAAWIARLAVPTLIGARAGDVLLPHLARLVAGLGTLPADVEVERFEADADARIWRALATRDGADADAIDAPLPASGVGDAIFGPPGRRVHWRGRVSGTLRPTVWIHESPGSARTLDVQTLTTMHDGPVLALDLPGHGESDPAAPEDMIDAVAETLAAMGLVDVGLAGFGSGAALVSALARRDPVLWRPATVGAARTSASTSVPAPFFATPRDDGGHLFAAWQRARDDAILGPWWSREAHGLHDFGDDLDWTTIHRSAVAQLVEHPLAAAWRAAIASRA